jgi:mRNA-degrading endonuclease toxin of MazEF toxin-antitoxin module
MPAAYETTGLSTVDASRRSQVAMRQLTNDPPTELTGLRLDSKAQAEQVRCVSVARLGAVMGRLPAPIMEAVDQALRVHLDL